jgi:hypothetical protein
MRFVSMETSRLLGEEGQKFTYAVILPLSWRKKMSAIVMGATHSALPENHEAIILEAIRLP